MLPLKILATGISIPTNKLSSEMLDQRHGFSLGTIYNASGIKSRYFFNDDDTLAQISALAIKDAVRRADIAEDSIDLVICASAVPEQALPCSAAKILDHLAVNKGTPGFDVNTSCLGFLTSLQIAASLLNTGIYKRIAIVATEFASRGINWNDLESSAIFGDGSASVIVEKGDGENQILSYLLETYPEGKELCEIRAGGSLRNITSGIDTTDYYFKMQGKKVFKMASLLINDFIDRLFKSIPCSLQELDAIIMHQASHLSIKHLTKRLQLAHDKVINIYEEHGNQVSASIPTALYHADNKGLLSAGNKILLLGSGAGICWGGMVLSV